MTGLTRRQTLGGLMGIAGFAALAGCSRGTTTSGSTAASGEATNLRLAWWGNELRDAQTAEAVDLYTSQNPGVTIETMPSEFSAYWDRLATQTAGNDTPDILQMGDGFLAEYGTRGALLDLEPYLDTSKFAPGTVDVGRIDGTLMGINIGINTPTIMCNLGVLEAAGVDLPDDTTWTWDDYLALSAEITKNTPAGTFGSASPGVEGVLRAWGRQHGQEVFTTEGTIGVDQDTMEGYFDLLVRFGKEQGMPAASVIIEDNGKSVEEAPLVVGSNAFQVWWTNQLSAVSSASGDDIVMLRMPTQTGKPEDLQAWYHPSMLWCASARTADPEVTCAFIDWWVNSVDLGKICLDERGRPCNTEVLAAIESDLSPAGQTVSQFLADLEPVLGDPQPVPPPGSGAVLGDILTRVQEDLYFGEIDAATAAEQFISESEAAIAGG